MMQILDKKSMNRFFFYIKTNYLLFFPINVSVCVKIWSPKTTQKRLPQNGWLIAHRAWNFYLKSYSCKIIDRWMCWKGYFLSRCALSLPRSSPSLSYLSPSLFHLPQTHTHKHKLYLSLFWAKTAFSKSHYTYTWNPEYDKNSLNDCALIGHSINVLAKELVHSPPLHISDSNPNPFDRTNRGMKT